MTLYIGRSAEQLYPLITNALSKQAGKKYNNKEWTLSDLDKWKTNDIVEIVKSRFDKENETWLTKHELQLLMDWKLAKGKFRPTLPKLILQNDPKDVIRATKAGFNTLLQFINSGKNDKGKDKTSELKSIENVNEKEYINMLKASLKQVTELRGVGPATGSLILSLASDITDLAPPFFSDEAFIYFVIEPKRSGSKIKYNVKEYVEEFIPCLLELLKESGESMVGIEKGSWALKMYDLNKLQTLSNVTVPFEIEDKDLFKYEGLEKRPGFEEKVLSEGKRKKDQVKEEKPGVKRRKAK